MITIVWQFQQCLNYWKAQYEQKSLEVKKLNREMKILKSRYGESDEEQKFPKISKELQVKAIHDFIDSRPGTLSIVKGTVRILKFWYLAKYNFSYFKKFIATDNFGKRYRRWLDKSKSSCLGWFGWSLSDRHSKMWRGSFRASSCKMAYLRSWSCRFDIKELQKMTAIFGSSHCARLQSFRGKRHLTLSNLELAFFPLV